MNRRSLILQITLRLLAAGLLLVATWTACGRLRRMVADPAAWLAGDDTAASTATADLQTQPTGPVVRKAIDSYGGESLWNRIEGLEFEMDWITVSGGREVTDPGIVQMANSRTPQIRITYTKRESIVGLGDSGPWVMLRGKLDDNAEFIQQGHYSAALYHFLLSLPFILRQRGVQYIDSLPVTWAGTLFDAVTVGFKPGGFYPWPKDRFSIWFNRNTGRIDRIFFLSTAEGSAFGPPPNYLWIDFKDYALREGLPVAQRWEFYRADEQRNRLDRLFDVHVRGAVINRSYLPVLFRPPLVAPIVKATPILPLLKPTATAKPKRTVPALRKTPPVRPPDEEPLIEP
jgi:hypothetical protein